MTRRRIRFLCSECAAEIDIDTEDDAFAAAVLRRAGWCIHPNGDECRYVCERCKGKAK